MSETFSGGCTCGEVRYRMGSRPLVTQCCHCSWCQRESGSAFAHNAMIETSRLFVEGEVETIDLPTASGRGQQVMRCPSCKIALFGHYGGSDKVAFVRVGTLDEPATLPPEIHVWTSAKQAWLVLPDGERQVPEYYKAGEVWSAEALERRKALFN